MTGADRTPSGPGADERDPIVARALRTLPPPDHGATFWTELDRHLDAVDAERTGTTAVPTVGGDVPPGDPHPLAADGPDRRSATGGVPALVVLDGGALHPEGAAPAPGTARRPPGRRPLAVAAAVLLIAALAAGIVTRPSGDTDEVEFADTPPITAPTTTAPSPPAPTATTATAPLGPPTTTPPVPDPVGGPTVVAPTSAGDAVIQFVTALAEEDGDRAEALLGEASRDYMAGLDGFAIENLYGSLYAAWGRPDVPDRQVSAPVLTSSGEGTLYVVVLRGNIGPVEGGPADGDAVTPFFVFETADAATYRVDIYPRGFEDAGVAPAFISPAVGDGLLPIEQGEPIRFRADDADEAYVSIDGGELGPAELVDGTWTYDPGARRPGPAAVVVVTTGAAGIGYDTGITEVVAPG